MLNDFDIPFDVTALIWCCCRNCSRLDQHPPCPILQVRDMQDSPIPSEDRWHYCADYQGPHQPADVWLVPGPTSRPTAARPKPTAQY